MFKRKFSFFQSQKLAKQTFSLQIKMSIAKIKEEIDEIMEEMEAATPKLINNSSKTFDKFQDKVPDHIDANKFEGSSFLSNIFAPPKVKKPGMLFPSRPTNDRYYDMSHQNIGIAVIFNQINIKGESERKGSEKDTQDLEQVLSDIGFTVKICINFTTKEIAQELTNCKLSRECLKIKKLNVRYSF